MNRRRLLKILTALPFINALWARTSSSAQASPSPARVRPGDPGWPAGAAGNELIARSAGS